MSASAVPTCADCGRTPRDDELTPENQQGAVGTGDGTPWTWSLSVDGPDRTLLCPACLRDHARSIEAKLDRDWW